MTGGRRRPEQRLTDDRGLRDRLCAENGGPLLTWYDAHRRDLPWRRTADPYAIWISEIMLQQTQTASVVPYYERWMDRFPTVEALAGEDEQGVLSLWQGLGYYRRCRLLLKGASWIVAHGMPTDAEGWRGVPGVGPYTAAAIASIALGEPVATVDGNVERVFARLTGCRAVKSELRSDAWDWARRNLYVQRPGDWNQALMELGAVVCTPRKPSCSSCPLRELCVALQSWQVDSLPVRRQREAVVQLSQVVWVPFCQGLFGVRKIPEGQWWEGMWEFPRVDASQGAGALEELVGSAWMEDLGTVRHAVSNHRIVVEASLVRCAEATESLRWLTAEELERLPMPAPQRKILRRALELA